MQISLLNTAIITHLIPTRCFRDFGTVNGSVMLMNNAVIYHTTYPKIIQTFNLQCSYYWYRILQSPMRHNSYVPCNLLPLSFLLGACTSDDVLHFSGSTFGRTCTAIVGRDHMKLKFLSHYPPFLATTLSDRSTKLLSVNSE